MSKQDEASFPSLMSDEEIERARQARRKVLDDPLRRKPKPDPWPIIERNFPRIAATIRDLWGKPALDEYFAKLIVDERGERQGFPLEVLDAFLHVAELHSERFQFNRPVSPWDAAVGDIKGWNKDRGGSGRRS